MEELTGLIVEAWRKVWAELEGDAGELAKRLARRRSKTFCGHPREWCLAIRSGDRRITAWETRLEPELRLARARAGREGHCFRRDECVPHKVYVTGELLIRLNRPVRLPKGGLEHHELAEMLGCDADSPRCARATGRLSSEYVAGLGGKHGPPIPICGTDKAMDPSRQKREMGDPIWGSMWEAMVRGDRRKKLEEFVQVVERVPVWRGRGSAIRGEAESPSPCPLPEYREREKRKYSYRVPKPPPDYVPYKWKDGVYLRYDWRNEFARMGWEKAEARRKRDREGKRLGRHSVCGDPLTPTLSRREREQLARGSIVFGGWAWVCPGCERTVKTLYYPVHAVRALDLLGETERSAPGGRGSTGIDEVDAYAAPVGSLACGKCHGVKFFSTMHANAWNSVVTHLSAGLLYGKEVAKPKWWKAQRKVEYVPRPNARPARRREEVKERMLLGWEREKIAKDLGMNVETVRVHEGTILREHGVKNCSELVEVAGGRRSAIGGEAGWIDRRTEKTQRVVRGLGV